MSLPDATIWRRAGLDLGQSKPYREIAVAAASGGNLGVGRRIGKMLNTYGVKIALQLARMNPAFVRKNLTVVLERTVRELNGGSVYLFKRPHPRSS